MSGLEGYSTYEIGTKLCFPHSLAVAVCCRQWRSGVDLFNSPLVSRQHKEVQKMEEETSSPPHTRTLPSMCCWVLVSITKPPLPTENKTQEEIVGLIFWYQRPSMTSF